MRFVIQVAENAQVEIEHTQTESIAKGFVVLIGVGQNDTKEIAERMVKKMLALRIFEDENGKTNRSLADVGGSLLLVSQFTLYADCKRGNRPGFTYAAPPALAEELYDFIVVRCREEVAIVATGEFGAHMDVTLTNTGPFTILLDSDELFG